MKHWTVSLVCEGRVAREWHVWAETLTVGSHGAAKVRLPLPAEPWALRISELPEPRMFQVAEFTLRIADTTAERARLWERAQIRIETALVRAEREAEAAAPIGPSTLQTAVTALCLAGFTHWLADMLVVGDSTDHELQAVIALAVASPPPATPQAPFASCDSVVAPVDAGVLVAGIAASKAPTAIRTAIVSVPVAHPEHASHGSGGGLFAHASDTDLPRTALVLAHWPDHGPETWESLDQPPPEPPH